MNRARKPVALVFVLTVAVLHLLSLRERLDPSWRVWYSSYFSDLLIPFAAYFLLFFAEDTWAALRSWQARAAVVIAVAGGAETLQFFHVWALGSTFDPMDFVMYGTGTAVAVLVDQVVLARVFGRVVARRVSAAAPPGKE